MYRYLNPEQEALIGKPKDTTEAEMQIRETIEAIQTWKTTAQKGSRNACITCGFYLGRIAGVFRQFPELSTSMKSEITELNQTLNDIAG